MSIRVLYDSLSFDWERLGGVTRYFTNLWQNLPPGVEYDIAVETTKNLYLQSQPFSIPVASDAFESFLPTIRFKGKLWLFDTLCKLGVLHSSKESNRRVFAKKLKEGNYDVIHLTGAHSFGDTWRPYVGRKPIVITVHDLIPDVLYGNPDIKRWRKQVFDAATRIITVSEHTKQDVMAFYGVPAARISVIHHGVDTLRTMKSVTSMEGKRYILYVGKRDGYKNFSFMVKALQPIFAVDHTLSLVCTGTGFSESECRLLENCGMLKRASARLYSDDELRWLYANALVFIYPSIYEGFGMPILDAFSFGCPVLLANVTCFPEIGGDAALYFDPKDEEDFRRQLGRVIGDDDAALKLRSDLILRGKERVKLFSWKKCADETSVVYQQTIKDFGRLG